VFVSELFSRTFHRQDGTKCAGTLRINGKLTTPQKVIDYGKQAGLAIGLNTYGY
jgi:hypothetical protein